MKEDILNKLHELEILVVSGSSGSTIFNLNENDHIKKLYKLNLYEINEEEINKLANYLLQADYESVLNFNTSDVFYCKYKGSNFEKDGLRYLTESAKYLTTVGDISSCIKQIYALGMSIALLQKFVCLNWTGPIQDETSYNFVQEIFKESYESYKNVIKSMLQKDGENIYKSVNHPEFLYLSYIMLSNLKRGFCLTSKWWLLRCLMIYQRILPERNMSIHSELKELLDELYLSDWINKHPNKSLKVQFLVEASQVNLYYHEIVPAKNFISEAMKMIGIEITFSGASGKRTHFQEKALAQLFIKVQRNDLSEEVIPRIKGKSIELCDLVLQDDVLLNKVKFVDSNNESINDLLPEEQIVLLAHCTCFQKSSAFDELQKEQMMAYIDCLLEQPNIFCVQVKSLLMRCKLEKSSSRRVERSMMQMESLLQALKKESPSALTRHYMFYSSSFPPLWILEKELADLLLSLGATKSALEVYQRLELWEDIVKCYQILDMNEKAAEIVKQQIEENETPLLWCLYGDLTDDIQCYFKAWEISNHKSSRAQRSLGHFYYKKKDYINCISYFKKSLEINHLQLNLWFSLAFAATQTEDHELAAHSYRQVVNLDPESFEAWNNLSNSYIKLKQKVRAHKALQEALKCNYEHWRVWENYLVVSVDIGAFEEAIQAYHRLLDIKGKYADSEILGILVKAVTENVLDCNNLPALRLKSKLLQLFGRVTSVVTNDPDIWRLYASLHFSDPDCVNNKESLDNALRYMQKSYRYSSQQANWEKDKQLRKKILDTASKLADMYFSYIKLTDGDIKEQNKASAKLMLKNVITRVEKQLPDLSCDDVNEIEPLLKHLSDCLTQIAEI